MSQTKVVLFYSEDVRQNLSELTTHQGKFKDMYDYCFDAVVKPAVNALSQLRSERYPIDQMTLVNLLKRCPNPKFSTQDALKNGYIPLPKSKVDEMKVIPNKFEDIDKITTPEDKKMLVLSFLERNYEAIVNSYKINVYITEQFGLPAITNDVSEYIQNIVDEKINFDLSNYDESIFLQDKPSVKAKEEETTTQPNDIPN